MENLKDNYSLLFSNDLINSIKNIKKNDLIVNDEYLSKDIKKNNNLSYNFNIKYDKEEDEVYETSINYFMKNESSKLKFVKLILAG